MDRRHFIAKTVLGGVALVTTPSTAMSAKSYRKVIGANDRIHVAIAGLGRRVGGYFQPIALKSSNVELLYLCDVMQKQREKCLRRILDHIDYTPKLENDIRNIIDDKQVDVLFNATPDHWHTPGSIMALQGGKHVYVEKPSSHNMDENEKLVEAAKTYDKVVQMGNQQRSSNHTIAVIQEIHNGIIGKPYKALAFYTNNRKEVPNQTKAPVPEGLDWELWQGPAPRRAYTHNTWDYNWHWYGWDYGTAEIGNNGIHELDIARWALQVDFPSHVEVEAYKRHFKDDGWDMYDTMKATFNFKDNVNIIWDGKSRNGYDMYGGGRGTIIYGSEGAVFVDRGTYKIYDINGELIKASETTSSESGTALGGGGDATTAHVQNFFEAIRGKVSLAAPIADANMSMAMVHYANMAYRIGKGFDINGETGAVSHKAALKLWGRTYQPGWELKI